MVRVDLAREPCGQARQHVARVLRGQPIRGVAVADVRGVIGEGLEDRRCVAAHDGELGGAREDFFRGAHGESTLRTARFTASAYS